LEETRIRELSLSQRLRELLVLFLKLGSFGFGGPLALIAAMEDEAVRKRRWLSREHFLEALALTNMLPGPNAHEMGVYLGYLRAGVRGAVLSGLTFILPPFLLMLGLSWLYFRYGTVPEVEGLFYGLKPVVIAIILVTVWRLGRGAITDLKLAALCVGALVLTWRYPSAEPITLLVAGGLGILLYAFPHPGRWLAAGTLLAGSATPPLLGWDGGTLGDLALLFLRTGGLLFGGGYVMIPLIEHDVVERFGWLTRAEFLDGVALGQSTPGPIIITATFIGYKAAGLAGAIVATAAIFLPSFLLAIIVARFVPTLRRWATAQAFLRGISAAVVGAVLATALVLARTAITDPLTGTLMAVALVAALALKANILLLLGAGAFVGLVTKGAF